MTTLTAPLRRQRVVGPAWVTWRQHRFALAGVVVLMVLIGVLFVVNGLAMHRDYHRLGLDTCGQLIGPQCGLQVGEFQHRYQSIADFLPRVLLFIPGVLGMFVGAPLVARELESGTFRFAWTQGTSRVRWLVTKLVLVGAALIALALAFSAFFTWWYGPFGQLTGRMASGQAYEVEGIVFAARTLFAFLLGTLLGAVIRRAVVAMAATAVAWLGLVIPSVIYWRPLIQAPVIAQDGTYGPGNLNWTLDTWVQDPSGHRLSNGDIGKLAFQAQEQMGSGVRFDFHEWLYQRGYRDWSKFQPESRFWHFQIVEASCYLAVSLLLAGACVWWVRRRA